MVPPLAVCAEDGVKLPQTVPPQVAVQFTPRLPGSFATVAAKVADAFTINAVGSVCVNTTGERIVVVATAGFAGVVAEEEAVIVTTLPGGTTAGAV